MIRSRDPSSEAFFLGRAPFTGARPLGESPEAVQLKPVQARRGEPRSPQLASQERTLPEPMALEPEAERAADHWAALARPAKASRC